MAAAIAFRMARSSRHYASGAGIIMQELAHLSGWAPIVGAILGFGFAGNTNFTAFADHLVMVRGPRRHGHCRSSPREGGDRRGRFQPRRSVARTFRLIRTGWRMSASRARRRRSKSIRKFLSYLPSNAAGSAPVVVPARTQTEVERAQALLDIVPANTRRSYDVRRVIELIADEGSVYEKKPTFAAQYRDELSPASMAGRSASSPTSRWWRAACWMLRSLREGRAFHRDLRRVRPAPLYYLIDVPGVAVGSAAKKTTLGRRSAKLVHEIGQSTVPRVSVVLRKGLRHGLRGDGGRTLRSSPTPAFAWPTAEVCAMSIDGAVDVAYPQGL